MKLQNPLKLYRFIRVAISRGWFSEYLQSGDVISPEDRYRIKKDVVNEHISKLQKELSD